MKKFLWFSTLVLVLLFAISCSNGNSSKKNDVTPDEDSDAESVDDDEKDDEENNNDSEPVRQPLECADFAEGLNENLIVGEGNNGLARSFILRLPKEIDSDKKFPVVFLYHGYGQDQGVDAASIEPFLKSYVDNETMPFILVVPEARSDIYGFNNIPPSGFDWDMMNLSDGSAEADMFDAVLDCLGKKWKIDETHIHVSGFSAGAITANSIALMRSEKVASILSYSGAYFSDAASRDALGELMGMKIGDFFSWPDFAEEHTKYPQVFVFGDKKEDAWGEAGMFTIYFNQMGRLGANYLTENGHDAILCEHDQDHIIAGISSESMIKFFAAHPFGTEKSSYREEMPEDFAEICHFFTEEDLEGDDENDGFLTIISDYKLTKTANTAKFYAGLTYLKLNDKEEALNYLLQFKKKEDVLWYACQALIGDLYDEQGDESKAITYYKKAVKNDDPYFTPINLFKLGQMYERSENWKEAAAAYKRIESDYYDQYQNMGVAKFAENVKSKL